jgi:hypothetical protein
MQVKCNTAFTQYNSLTQKAKNKLNNYLYRFIEIFFQIAFVIQVASLLEVSVFFLSIIVKWREI